MNAAAAAAVEGRTSAAKKLDKMKKMRMNSRIIMTGVVV